MGANCSTSTDYIFIDMLANSQVFFRWFFSHLRAVHWRTADGLRVTMCASQGHCTYHHDTVCVGLIIVLRASHHIRADYHHNRHMYGHCACVRVRMYAISSIVVSACACILHGVRACCC